MKNNSLFVTTATILVSAITIAGEYDECPPKAFAKVRDSIVIIAGNKGSGTGFIVEMDGAKWLMTNEHVVRGQGVIRARTLSGRKIVPTNTVDLAANRDVIRYKLDGDFKALKWRKTSPNMNEDIWVFGNSDGSGVITSLNGDVIGLGEDKIELSAKFVAGNSGSPVIDANGDVVGIATFAEIKRDWANWVKAGTRFNDVRRFAVTLGSIEWEPLGYNQYCEDCRSLAASYNQCLGFMDLVQSTGTARNSKVMFKLAKNIDKTELDAINKDKESRKVYVSITSADAAYEKAVKAYDDTEKKMRNGVGKIGRPTETTMKRRMKDISVAYDLMMKSRRDALKRAKEVAEGCVVKSIRSKSTLAELRDNISDLIDLYDQLVEKQSNQ